MIHKRIKQIRNEAKLTQEEFAKRLGVKRNTVATYEMGRSTPIDAVLSLICREFNINDEWLRTGNGQPYTMLPKNEMVEKAASLLSYRDPNFEALINIYSELDKDDREILIRIGSGLLESHKKKE